MNKVGLRSCNSMTQGSGLRLIPLVAYTIDFNLSSLRITRE